MSRRSIYLASAMTSALLGSVSLASADCSFTPALTTQTKCIQAVAIPGNPLLSYDISWFSTERNQYYLGDRSNAGIDVIGFNNVTHKWEWQRTLGGFVGVVLNSAHTAVDNNHSGPDGVASHGRWVYGGDGNSTLKVFDLDAPPASALKNTIGTGGTTRLDEMALTSDGELLIGANNAEDPPFATLFRANGDRATDHSKKLIRITVDSSIIPAGFGLSLEQPAWDPKTKRFITSIPIIAENPPGCNYGQLSGAITCDGGVLITDPEEVVDAYQAGFTAVTQGAYNHHTNSGVVPLHGCGPNGASVGPNDNVLLGCNPANNPSNVILDVINATSRAQTAIASITGADEVWYNKGDNRYYTGSSRDCKVPGTPCPTAGLQSAVLGVINAGTNTLIEKVPQSSGSHSVAADAKHNFIFVPQNAAAGIGHDTTTVGAGICGTNNGCVAVYQHQVPGGGDGDHDRDDDHDHDHH